MAETKYYEEGEFRIELTPQGDPHRGTLVTRFPEMAPYAAEVDLSKKRSRSEYLTMRQRCGAWKKAQS